jgi:hypothetical protein
MLYRSTDRLCRCGAAVQNLSHSASFDSCDKNAPSKPGIKQLGIAEAMSERAIEAVAFRLIDEIRFSTKLGSQNRAPLS